MSNSIFENASVLNKQLYKYVQSTLPAELHNFSSYILDFTNHKFIQIGINLTNMFAVTVHIIKSN